MNLDSLLLRDTPNRSLLQIQIIDVKYWRSFVTYFQQSWPCSWVPCFLYPKVKYWPPIKCFVFKNDQNLLLALKVGLIDEVAKDLPTGMKIAEEKLQTFLKIPGFLVFLLLHCSCPLTESISLFSTRSESFKTCCKAIYTQEVGGKQRCWFTAVYQICSITSSASWIRKIPWEPREEGII